jgi:hypothetical protein
LALVLTSGAHCQVGLIFFSFATRQLHPNGPAQRGLCVRPGFKKKDYLIFDFRKTHSDAFLDSIFPEIYRFKFNK